MGRIVNKDLLDKKRGLPCIICLKPGVAHHVKTQGSGGDDVEENLMQLCFEHHREIHDHPLTDMVLKYPQVEQWLNENGWRYDTFMRRYIRLGPNGWED